jgi:glycosyltransferase involved in cell wall biosynthesis
LRRHIKPHISYLVFNLKQNGGNKVVFEHVNRLSERGYDVSLYSVFGTQQPWFKLKVPIHNLFALITHNYLDVLVCTYWPTAWISLFIRARRKIYLVQGWEEKLHKNRVLQQLAKLTYSFNIEKIAISNFLYLKLKNQNRKVHKISGHGIDTSVFYPAAYKEKSRTSIYILSVVSSYIWPKGIDLLTESVRKLKEKYPYYHFTLVSFEKKSYSPLFDRFFSNPKPVILGRLYRNSDILLSTSRSEGFFLPGLEAMASKCLFITTNSGGVQEYAINSKNALFIKDNKELWQKDTIKSIMIDHKERNRLLSNAYVTAQSYKWDKVINNLERIYNY